MTKTSKFFWITLLAGLLAGCQVAPPAPLNTPLTLDTSTFTPCATASLTLAASTLTPTPLMPTIATPFPPLAQLPTSGIAYILPLTVQEVSEQSAQLLFELERPAEGSLLLRQVGQAGAFVQAFPSPPALLIRC